MQCTSVIIIGSGPAAYTAALYTSRLGTKPILYVGDGEDVLEGGQLMTTTLVENYPGFPSIQGPDLISNMRKQVESQDVSVIQDMVSSVDLSVYPYKVIPKNGKPVSTSCIIIATGAKPRRLEIPGAGDDELWQKGISTCAKCDGPLPVFRNKPIAVVGGGDAAMEEVSYLSKFGSTIYLIHRGSKFRASEAMSKRVYNDPKVEIIWNHIVVEALGDKMLEKIVIENVNSKERRELIVSGLFLAIGHIPNTEFLGGQIKLDASGYIEVVNGTCRTSKEGVYAAGDVHDKRYRQAITASGYGCMAAIEAIEYLGNKDGL